MVNLYQGRTFCLLYSEFCLLKFLLFSPITTFFNMVY